MLLFSMLLMAAQAAPAAPTATTAAAEDRVMCRMIQEAYSRIPSRVCRKQSEWDRAERETQAEMRSSRHQRTTGGPTQ
jgi:hypothetical protein